DDIVYIMNNDMITAFTWANLKKIFSTYFMGNYHPLVLISFMADFHFFKFSAPGYHVHNLLLHILNAVLVYTFFFHLLKKNSNVAITVALLFALHPMHVESVAWVSERKDVLYTAYYFLSLISYLFYIQKGRNAYYFLALLLFLFSNLSKAQAVTLPVILILTDYYLSRKTGWKIALEKIPFFLMSLSFGVVAVFAQQASNYFNPLKIPWSQSIFYAPYGLWLYLVKFLFPINQIAVYEYPAALEGTFPLYLYLSPFIFLILFVVIWKTWKNQKYISFGFLFFLATIFPVLQFLPVGVAVAAERYTYIPYIGLSFIVAVVFWEKRSGVASKYRYIVNSAGILIIALLLTLTWQRTMVWKNSLVFWTDVISKNPRCARAYYNRAVMYNEMTEYEKALTDLTEGIKYDSNDARGLNLYTSRSLIHQKLGNYPSALNDCSVAIRKNPANLQAWLDRGVLYTDKFAQYDSGIRNFKMVIKLNPDDIGGNFNLGIAYYKQNNFDSAKIYFLKSTELNPANGNAHSFLTTLFYQGKDFSSAYSHGLMAKKYGVQVDSVLMNYLKQNLHEK
ncbi:MAG: tetratricopeptide repeat protein, partial [bacterium]